MWWARSTGNIGWTTTASMRCTMKCRVISTITFFLQVTPAASHYKRAGLAEIALSGTFLGFSSCLGFRCAYAGSLDVVASWLSGGQCLLMFVGDSCQRSGLHKECSHTATRAVLSQSQNRTSRTWRPAVRAVVFGKWLCIQERQALAQLGGQTSVADLAMALGMSDVFTSTLVCSTSVSHQQAILSRLLTSRGRTSKLILPRRGLRTPARGAFALSAAPNTSSWPSPPERAP